MQELWYYEPVVRNGKLVYDKILMTIDENRAAKEKFNLTQLGLEHINTVAELKEHIIGDDTYNYYENKNGI